MSATQRFKSLIRDLCPGWILRLRNRYTLARIRRAYGALSVQEAFRRTYLTGGWGQDFNSGRGSNPATQGQYIEFVRDFIRRNRIETVADLGCGNFRIGQQIATGVKYVGVDIVPEIVERNQRLYASESVTFTCRNLLEDELPLADLCLVRQVLQHLSNDEIQIALGRLDRYPLVLITEHVPAGSFVPNLDKPHGPDTRVRDNSGIVLDQYPFSVESETVLDVPLDEHSRLRTCLIRPSQHQR